MVEKIKVALVGLGNCFSGLIEGIEYYRKNPSQQVIGIIHDKLRDYSIHDIDFVAGFDVGENKIGKAVNEAIYESPNMVNWIDKNDMPKAKYSLAISWRWMLNVDSDLVVLHDSLLHQFPYRVR